MCACVCVRVYVCVCVCVLLLDKCEFLKGPVHNFCLFDSRFKKFADTAHFSVSGFSNSLGSISLAPDQQIHARPFLLELAAKS